MPTQFIHVNTYGFNASVNRKKECRTLSGVFGELMRTPSYSKHVKEPGSVDVLYGSQPADEYKRIKRSFEAYRMPSGRRMRSDALAAIVGVSSWPVPIATVRDNPEEMRRFTEWQKRDLAFLKATYGDNLRFVVQHSDEQFPHHHWCVATDEFSELLDLHPGHKARRAALKEGKPCREANEAYKQAMHEFQLLYHDVVAEHLDLDHVGPQRKRFSRAAYCEKVRAGEWIPGVGPVEGKDGRSLGM